MLGMAALPALTSAQPGRGARGGGPGPGSNPIAPLIDMRRELDLSTRQLVQLDSIERTLLRRNRDLTQGIQGRRDTALARRPRQELTEDERQALRSRMQARRDSIQPLLTELRRNDSTARAAALRVLTDSQRVRVREFQAERRGFARGQGMAGMARRGQMERGLGGRGFRGEMGPRGRFAPRGPMGPRGEFGPRGRMQPMPNDFGLRGLGPRMRRPGRGPDGLGPDGPALRRFRERLDVVPRRAPRPPVEPDSGGGLGSR
jgi:hypothetical protein